MTLMTRIHEQAADEADSTDFRGFVVAVTACSASGRPRFARCGWSETGKHKHG
jgi:hypothetical protein